VPTERLPITSFLDVPPGALLLDVRSPGEYLHGHIPGAFNLPLFSDEERKEVGTSYKQDSREAAIKIGLDFFGPKMRKMVETVEGLFSSHPKVDGPGVVHIYCWRGGMRSSAVAWLLDLYGFKVKLLSGGYKVFRRQVLDTFEMPFPLSILGGYTGSGKTELLFEMEKRGETVIHLEALASHKGSAFGNINMPPQPSQEMFENLLAVELWQKGEAGMIWLEDESQRIGNRNIPDALWQQMRVSPISFLEIPFEERLNHIFQGYSNCPEERLEDAIGRIRKRLGGLETKNALIFLKAGNLKECFRILLSYYDKLYIKSLNKRDGLETLVRKIECPAVSIENVNSLLLKHQTI
jgi:tRNA 2-selenouridine synthase